MDSAPAACAAWCVKILLSATAKLAWFSTSPTDENERGRPFGRPLSFWLRGKDSNLRPPGYRFAPFAVPEMRCPRYHSAHFDRGTRLCLAVSAAGSARQRAPTSSARRPHNPESAAQTRSITKKISCTFYTTTGFQANGIKSFISTLIISLSSLFKITLMSGQYSTSI